MAAGRAGYFRPAGPSRLQLGMTGMRESAQGSDRGETQCRKAAMSVFRGTPVFLVDQDDFSRNARALDDGLPPALSGSVSARSQSVQSMISLFLHANEPSLHGQPGTAHQVDEHPAAVAHWMCLDSSAA